MTDPTRATPSRIDVSASAAPGSPAASPVGSAAGRLLVVSGPSGVGKTTITRSLERSLDDGVFSVSVTTRARTKADADGVDYRFVTDAEFDDLIAQGKL
ncbi:MAG: guanylate kinase, partial [Planctomycetota bacterium]